MRPAPTKERKRPDKVRPLGEIAADQLVELGGLLLERARVVQEGLRRIDDQDDLVGPHVRQAEGAVRNDAVRLERLQPPDEVEEQVVVGLVAPDLLDLPFGARPEDQHGEGAVLLELLGEVLGQGGDRREARVPVVQPGPFLQPLTPKGDEFALATLVHEDPDRSG